jgi:DNA helicase-2/ATP-dependent DNA helicase PcrA
VRSLLDDLSPPQREAVEHDRGPLLVLAGAGSGKTRVLTYRIAHLLATGAARAHEITAMTFTNKAAGEMAERVAGLVGRPLAGGFVGTFHRWALGVLRRHPEAAGLTRRFSILDRDDQVRLISRILKGLDLDPRTVAPRAVLATISASTNRGQGLDQFDATASTAFAADVARVWRRYVEHKRSADAVDFDDMLVKAVGVLRDQPAIRDVVRARGRWLLVDEFQDTNALQMDLLRLVVSDDNSITAVGDEDQSIYRWRGAEMANILSFESFFPAARVVALEENYRSTQPILAAASALVAHNRNRRGKKLFTSRSGGQPVRLYVGEDERAEARWVADRLEELAVDVPLGQMAVLLRTNAQTRPFEDELTRRRMPYRVIGGLRFWQRAEVKDALAYLRLVVHPEDEIAFRRVVNVPARGIGAATIDALERAASDGGLNLPAAARTLPSSLTPRARMSLERFFAVLAEAAESRSNLEPGDLVGWLLEASGLLAMYQGDDDDRVARRENLQELASAVAESAARGQDLEQFLDNVALLGDGDEAATPDAVSLMTLHSAKGLEFDVVVLGGLEDGLLPHANARRDDDGLEEERRLAYVGMTRARRWLALTAARTRLLFGQRQPSQPSPFLPELPVDQIKDVSDVPVTLGSEPAPATPPRPAARTRTRPAPRARPPRPTVADSDGENWRPGLRVRHKRFGTGLVLKCIGRGPGLKLIVYFDRAGTKTLVPTIAKLEKI